MDDIHQFLALLNDRDSTVRLKACQQLELESVLPPDAIVTLKQALYDPDPRVGLAVRRALSIHGHDNGRTESTSWFPPDSSRSTDRLVQIGNLGWNHVLFLLAGVFMMCMIGSHGGGWGTLIILLFMIGCITIPGTISLHKQKRLVEIWSEFAQQTGLKIDRGTIYFLGNSIPPSVSGVYRGRRVSVSKYVQYEASYEGSIPVVFTCTSIDVKNPGAAYLAITPKSLMGRLFKTEGISSGDQQLDKRFKFDGHPADFLRKALRLFVQHSMSFEHPKGVILRTDSPLTITNWARPSIYLQGLALTCFQSGVLTDVQGQVQILNLLCDLAELVEETDRE